MTVPHLNYQIDFPARGILVDDMGHPLDLTTALQCVFREIFGEA